MADFRKRRWVVERKKGHFWMPVGKAMPTEEDANIEMEKMKELAEDVPHRVIYNPWK